MLGGAYFGVSYFGGGFFGGVSAPAAAPSPAAVFAGGGDWPLDDLPTYRKFLERMRAQEEDLLSIILGEEDF